MVYRYSKIRSLCNWKPKTHNEYNINNIFTQCSNSFSVWIVIFWEEVIYFSVPTCPQILSPFPHSNMVDAGLAASYYQFWCIKWWNLKLLSLERTDPLPYYVITIILLLSALYCAVQWRINNSAILLKYFNDFCCPGKLCSISHWWGFQKSLVILTGEQTPICQD